MATMTMGTCKSVACKSEIIMRPPATFLLAIASAVLAHSGPWLCAEAAFVTGRGQKGVGAPTRAVAMTDEKFVRLTQVRPQKRRETTSLLLHAQKKPGKDLKSPQGGNSNNNESKVNYVRIFSPLNPYMVRECIAVRCSTHKSVSPRPHLPVQCPPASSCSGSCTCSYSFSGPML
jgi:hypothetical protein